jgi:uncharacterized protein (TIGR02598 family)
MKVFTNIIPRSRRGLCPGFSLIEVVIAIGIVSFALLSVIGVFGGVIRTSKDNADRRSLTEAVDALRASLNDTNFVTFSTLYGWVQTNKQLMYITFYADSNGVPAANSSYVVSQWIDPSSVNLSTYDTYRSGNWLKAKLTVSSSNPGGTNLPAIASYTRASLFVTASIDSVATTNQALPNNPRLNITIAVRR